MSDGSINIRKSHIRGEKNNVKMLFFKCTHYLLDIILFFLAFLWFRYGTFKFEGFELIGFRYNYFVTIGYALLLYWFEKTYNSNLFGFTRIRYIALSQFLAQFFAVIIAYIAVCIGWKHYVAPWPFINLLVIQAAIDILYAYSGTYLFFKMFPRRRTLLIYRNSLDRKRFGAVRGKPVERLHSIVDEIEFDGSFHELEPKLKGYDAVFVAGLNSRCRNGILKYCEAKGIRGFFLPHIGDVIMQGAQHIQAFDSPVMMARRKTLRPEYRVTKRAFDILFSALGLIIASPIMLITVIAIKAYDGGPVFYKQVRLTRNEKQFKIIKFRSMRVDAEKDGVARLSSGEKDDRITPVGKIVRKSRLDELPQLINILKGEMSIVGPRPERPEIAEEYYKYIPDFRLRLQVKAGLTGYAQVYGKYNSDPYEKLEFDLMYINNMGLLTDLDLMFATAGILFLPESTEGVAVGATTAMDYENQADGTENDAEMAGK